MTEEQVLEAVRAELERIKVPGAAEATLETTWQELDVDSLDLVELVRALEDRYGIEIHDDKLKAIESIGDAVRLVQSLGEGAGTPA